MTEATTPLTLTIRCGYCKQAKPKFFETAKILATDARIVLGSVDCTAEKSLCQEYKIEGFPIITYLSYGKDRKDYTGKHETSSFVAFVESGGQISKSQIFVHEHEFGKVIKVLNENNFDQVVNSGNVFVMFFSPWCEHCNEVKPEFLEAAEHFHFGKFAVVDCTVWDDLCEKQSVKSYPTFQIFVNGAHHDYSGSHTSLDFTAGFMIIGSAKTDL
ncbi:unnamed protein product [Litomosoides sigmodontis]|uniref:Thioredoxin domain-containing protein n=1 Tax=Litomosoides sigmodontis TaxID=42156 RepID=A0A3P6T318_LITSI|nr:unnamed protein product [Litomosoides sigmodontis]